MRHSYQSSECSFSDIYREALAEAADGARFVQVGSLLGRSAASLAVEIRRSNKRIELYCVETSSGTPGTARRDQVVQAHGESIRDIFDRTIRRGEVAGVDNVIRADSVAAAAKFPDGSLDFVFIDADRGYEALRRDIAAWAPKVRADGVLAGHGHSAEYPGVIRGVTEYLSRYDAERTIRGTCWWYRKPSMNFTVAVTTAPREVTYLESTLDDIARGTSVVALPHPVRVCVSADAAGVAALKRDRTGPPSVLFEAAAPESWELVRGAGPHRRCCANTWQALAGAPPGCDVLLLQDDIELADAWPLHLRYRLRLARQHYGDRFILALYASYGFGGEHLAVYPTESFYGNQAVYFPAAVAAEYARCLWEHVLDYRLADDMVLKEYARHSRMPLLVSLPNLAQHLGRLSTGLGQFHVSSTYRRSL